MWLSILHFMGLTNLSDHQIEAFERLQARDKLVSLLKRGEEVWNAWRAAHPRVNTDLSRADLSGADLSRANLSRANLSRANLSGADLSGANLRGTKLYGANLSGAELTGTNLTGADLNGASFDKKIAIILKNSGVISGWKQLPSGIVQVTSGLHDDDDSSFISVA